MTFQFIRLLERRKKKGDERKTYTHGRKTNKID